MPVQAASKTNAAPARAVPPAPSGRRVPPSTGQLRPTARSRESQGHSRRTTVALSVWALAAELAARSSSSSSNAARPVWPMATNKGELTGRRLVITFVPTTGWKLEDSRRAGAVAQVPSESSHRTRSIAAITAGSSGSSPSSRRASSASTPSLDADYADLVPVQRPLPAINSSVSVLDRRALSTMGSTPARR
jgi:hypothetical protein